MKDMFNRSTIKRLTYVQITKFETRISREMPDVIDIAGKQIIDGDYFISFCQQSVAKMRSKEACATCHKYRHITLLLRNKSARNALRISRHGAFLPDRKSTRLNSSHRCISYAVF